MSSQTIVAARRAKQNICSRDWIAYPNKLKKRRKEWRLKEFWAVWAWRSKLLLVSLSKPSYKQGTTDSRTKSWVRTQTGNPLTKRCFLASIWCTRLLISYSNSHCWCLRELAGLNNNQPSRPQSITKCFPKLVQFTTLLGLCRVRSLRPAWTKIRALMCSTMKTGSQGSIEQNRFIILRRTSILLPKQQSWWA